MLKFQKVNLVLDKKNVLQNLNFEVSPGEIVAILGTSGAGKSSIFQLLTGEKKPTNGSIQLDNFQLESLSSRNLQKYRRQIGVVFQNFCLLPQKTVRENISFALEICGEESLIPKRVPALLELVGLTDRENAFPEKLSGGERQRVAIARALAHAPKILIADEPTGNLDPGNAREIAELFRKLHAAKKCMILVATHDPVLVKTLRPRVLRLENGKILEDSNTEKVANEE